MSDGARDWAWRQGTRSPSEKIILVCLAHTLDEITGVCAPSIPTIAAQCACSERTVYRALAVLAEDGLIVRRDRQGHNTHYELMLGNGGQDTPAAVVTISHTMRLLAHEEC